MHIIDILFLVYTNIRKIYAKTMVIHKKITTLQEII